MLQSKTSQLLLLRKPECERATPLAPVSDEQRACLFGLARLLLFWRKEQRFVGAR
jgi:hypothetical protein